MASEYQLEQVVNLSPHLELEILPYKIFVQLEQRDHSNDIVLSGIRLDWG